MTSLRPIAAAAVCTLAAFGAHAGVAIEGSGAGPDTLSRTTAERMVVEPQGIGHIQLIPYYSTNAGNQTLFSITNEDAVNGKVVKVRFRSMGNGDTVYDFTLFLGPGDVWAANVSQGRDGKARLVSIDTSCSAPPIAVLNGSFVTDELPPVSAQFTASARDAWTREGFIEVINVADLAPTLNSSAKAGQPNPLFVATRQVNGIARCGQAELDVLLNDVANEADAAGKGLDTPSGGLSAYAFIVNTQDALLSWSVEPTTLRAVTGQGKRARARLVVSPQTADAVDVGRARALTADPLLTQGRLTARQYHFPDLSTPYVAATTAATPFAQATHTGESMAVTQFSNQYSTLAVISSMTDFVATEPMKRYFVGLDYAAASDADKLVIPVTNGFYGTPNTLIYQNRVCHEYTTGLGYKSYDREGRNLTNDGTGFSVPLAPRERRIVFCGGASVYGINSGPASTVLKSAPAYRVYPFTSFQEGWLRFDTPGAGSGMPIIGLSVTSSIGVPSNGASTNYGWTVKHKGTPFER